VLPGRPTVSDSDRLDSCRTDRLVGSFNCGECVTEEAKGPLELARPTPTRVRESLQAPPQPGSLGRSRTLAALRLVDVAQINQYIVSGCLSKFCHRWRQIGGDLGG
jgi:hypothetical protein